MKKTLRTKKCLVYIIGFNQQCNPTDFRPKTLCWCCYWPKWGDDQKDPE